MTGRPAGHLRMSLQIASWRAHYLGRGVRRLGFDNQPISRFQRYWADFYPSQQPDFC
jgi:hypothetical protein